MSTELKKRILTSISLFLIVLTAIFVSKYIFVFSIFVISYLAFNELRHLIANILRKKNKNMLIFNIYIFSFLLYFLLFSIISIEIYFIEGVFFFFYILFICIFTDIGGYVIGNLIGGKKLIKISPNKTISGSIGSFFFSIVPLIIFSNIFKNDYSFSPKEIFFCLEVSFVAQLGDLFISFIKRKGKVKDTGSILPGHGGLLDRIDGIIFAIPFIGYYLYGLSFFSYSQNFLQNFIK